MVSPELGTRNSELNSELGTRTRTRWNSVELGVPGTRSNSVRTRSDVFETLSKRLSKPINTETVVVWGQYWSVIEISEFSHF